MRYILPLISFLLFIPCHSQSTILLERDKDFEFSSEEHLGYWVQGDIFSIEMLSAEKFGALDERPFDLNDLTWYYLKLSNHAGRKVSAVFTLSFEGDVQNVLYKSPEGSLEKLTNFSGLFYNRYLIDLEKDEEVELYFRLDHANGLSFSYDLESVDNFSKQIESRYFYLGLYYGLGLVIGLLLLVFYFIVRERIYVQMLLFYGFFLGIFISHEGLITYMRISQPLDAVLTVVLHLGFAFMLITMSKEFSRSVTEKRFRGLILLFGITAICFLVFLITQVVYLLIAGEFLIGLIELLLLFIVAIDSKFTLEKSLYLGFLLLLIVLHWLANMPFVFGADDLILSFNVAKFIGLLVGIILIVIVSLRIRSLKLFSLTNKRRVENFGNIIEEMKQKLNEEQLSDKERLKLKRERFISISKRENLSDRELEVLRLMTKGYSNPKIAEKLFISVNTVKFHVKNILIKLNLKNKKEMMDIIDKS